jgi:hypothetical protein
MLPYFILSNMMLFCRLLSTLLLLALFFSILFYCSLLFSNTSCSIVYKNILIFLTNSILLFLFYSILLCSAVFKNIPLFANTLFFLGEVEGFLGVIRFLGVLPRYHGLCIGRRLICRVEEIMVKKDCVRCMCCIPDPRYSMADWVKRRGE